MRPKTLDTFDRVTIQSERDLHAVLQEDPKLDAIPDSAWTCGKKLRKMLRTTPIELECGPDEVFCLVDSVSRIKAAWVEKLFSQYAKHVRETSKSLRGDHAATAGGAKLYNKGRAETDGTDDGKPFPINLKDMEVELPNLSVRKMVKNQNDVHFVPEGGWIQHRDTGRVIKFYEHEGVYFTKLKMISWVLHGLGLHDQSTPSMDMPFKTATTPRG